jgi:multiple sugar transport system substrate-binding protein
LRQLRKSARVREWNLFGGGVSARLLQIHAKFVAEHKDIDFEAFTLARGPRAPRPAWSR